MPLIACPECTHQVSTRAARCPSCGRPIADAPPAASRAPMHRPADTALTLRVPQSSARFYSGAQVRAAAFLGSILCGSHLIAANWRRLGRPDAASKTWVVGVATFVVAVGLGQLMPDKAAAQFGIAAGLVYIAVAERLQKGQRDIVAKRVSEGAGTASAWLVFALVTCYLAAIVAAIALTLL